MLFVSCMSTNLVTRQTVILVSRHSSDEHLVQESTCLSDFAEKSASLSLCSAVMQFEPFPQKLMSADSKGHFQNDCVYHVAAVSHIFTVIDHRPQAYFRDLYHTGMKRNQ